MSENDVGWEQLHLINDYLCLNPSLIQYGGFGNIAFSDLERALHMMRSFDRPDMYAILENRIVILEHFQFDASRETRKGMRGKQEENRLQILMNAVPPDGEFHIEKSEYSLSLEDWVDNFETHFQKHYDKIDAYIERVKMEADISDNREVSVGFFIEDQYSPIVEYAGKIFEVKYTDTVQFLDFFSSHQKVDFILFGTHYKGTPQLFYIDHHFAIPREAAIDLRTDKISLSKLNQNAVITFAKSAIIPQQNNPTSAQNQI